MQDRPCCPCTREHRVPVKCAREGFRSSCICATCSFAFSLSCGCKNPDHEAFRLLFPIRP
ncbi:hypothetical protein BDZ97DRAFT_1816259 [Flammula alnicola]|nr:hypothetical protein BDZ97DRAFT_1816259 [Flammula alnicola]